MSGPRSQPPLLNSSTWLSLVILACAVVLPSCSSDGNFTVLGYSTQPQYNPNIRTIYVPIFQNLTFRRDMEFDLTRAVIREIEAKTPYKVVSSKEGADTELTGTIISFNKNMLNRNQLNEVREAETTLAVEVVWRDLRSGEVLTQPQRKPGVTPTLPPPAALTPDGPPDAPPPPPPPVLVQSVATFKPELGESITTAAQANVNRLAIQIVSMMEMPW